MVQYIDKDALVAEIENLEKELKNACKPDPFGDVEECMTAAELQALDVVKETINTLEVKEVDLEKEISDNWETGYLLGIGFGQYADIAKHFFELGMQQSKNHNNNEE